VYQVIDVVIEFLFYCSAAIRRSGISTPTPTILMDHRRVVNVGIHVCRDLNEYENYVHRRMRLTTLTRRRDV
jgi:hypothetical protein